CWHSDCEPWQVEQMFIIASPVCWASANVRALSVSASSWLCSAITPAPQQLARSSVTSSMPSRSATSAIEPCSSGVKPRETQPGTVAPPVVLVFDVELVRGQPPQAHDLVHRRDAFRARVDAGEAVGAVVDPMRVLREVVEPLPSLEVARVAHEAIGLSECRRA